MPPLETSDLDAKAVLWAKVGVNEHAEPIVAAPVEIDVRWVGSRSLVTDPQGNTTMLDATVIVDQKIPVDSILWNGELADWVGTGSGADDEELYSVKKYMETPDERYREVRRSVGVMRYTNSLPAISS